jgi:GT2 family glycosyltransferase
MTATPSKVRLGCVINYYNPKSKAALRAQTEFCALKALSSQDSSLEVEILVSDGSGHEDVELKTRLAEQGVVYLASPVPLGFAQGYNQGLRYFAKRSTPPELVATCANDVFCDLPTLPLLAGALLTDSAVGCAMPYLSHSDYVTQNDWVHLYYREASSMTFNLNVFRLKDLAEIGFIPEAFSGYYNDIATLIELRTRGLKAVLINSGRVTHLGMATTSTGSMARSEADRETFRRLYPAYSLPGGNGIRQEKLAAGLKNRAWLYAQSRGPASWRKLLVELSRLGLQFGRFFENLRASRS